jgi:hypothetical protein
VSTVNVYPVDDLIEHETGHCGDDCVCGPDVEYGEEGAKLIIHHSLDGREVRNDACSED